MNQRDRITLAMMYPDMPELSEITPQGLETGGIYGGPGVPPPPMDDSDDPFMDDMMRMGPGGGMPPPEWEKENSRMSSKGMDGGNWFDDALQPPPPAPPKPPSLSDRIQGFYNDRLRGGKLPGYFDNKLLNKYETFGKLMQKPFEGPTQRVQRMLKEAGPSFAEGEMPPPPKNRLYGNSTGDMPLAPPPAAVIPPDAPAWAREHQGTPEFRENPPTYADVWDEEGRDL